MLACDGVQQSSAVSVHPAVYLFLAAQLLIGLGGCGLFVFISPYIDENSPPTKSAFYIGMFAFQQFFFSLGI